jgi:hypothetical protein
MTGDTAHAGVAALVNRRVTAEELQEALDRPLGAAERDEILALVRWFRRRYPTPLDRLSYVRRAYWRWSGGRARGGLGDPKG